jgi:hypothetical protein
MVLHVKKIFMPNMTYGVNEQGRRVSDRLIFQLSNPVFGCYACYGVLCDLRASLLKLGTQIPHRFACGIISNSLWLLENSAKKLQCAYSELSRHLQVAGTNFTSFVFSESHYHSLRGIVRLANFNALRF